MGLQSPAWYDLLPLSNSWDTSGWWENTHNWAWFSATGWWLDFDGVTDSSTTGDTRGYYINQVFCNPLDQTYADHYTTKITTSPSSDIYNWSYSMNKYGDCSGLLSYHYSVS